MAEITGRSWIRRRTAHDRTLAAGSLALAEATRHAERAEALTRDLAERRGKPVEVLFKFPKEKTPPPRPFARGGWQAILDETRHAVAAGCRALELLQPS